MINLEVNDKKTKLNCKDANFHEALYGIHTLIELIKENQEKMTNEDIYKFIDMIELESKKVD